MWKVVCGRKYLRHRRVHWMKLRIRSSANVTHTKIHLATFHIISYAHSIRNDAYLQGERVLSSYLSLFSHLPSHSISFFYLSFDVFCFVNNRPKRGRLLVQFLTSCVLEIVNRNKHGLICLLVHTKRNSPCSAEENAVSGLQFEELHRRLSTSKKRMSNREEWSEGVEPSKVYCWRKAIGLVITSEEIDCSDGRRRQSEDVAFFSSFFFHSFES